mmetsp:Transcript_24309/g.68328  ORF Transcript_24309/g.68328 Transcript_24309/m.68328 type:complete len:141 (+) Transcript_24309:162-584(+)
MFKSFLPLLLVVFVMLSQLTMPTTARRSTGLDSYCNLQMQILGWDSCPHGLPINAVSRNEDEEDDSSSSSSSTVPQRRQQQQNGSSKQQQHHHIASTKTVSTTKTTRKTSNDDSAAAATTTDGMWGMKRHLQDYVDYQQE